VDGEGHVVTLPYVLATPPADAHSTKVASVQELEFRGADEPDGHGIAEAEPEGQ